MVAVLGNHPAKFRAAVSILSGQVVDNHRNNSVGGVREWQCACYLISHYRCSPRAFPFSLTDIPYRLATSLPSSALQCSSAALHEGVFGNPSDSHCLITHPLEPPSLNFSTEGDRRNRASTAGFGESEAMGLSYVFRRRARAVARLSGVMRDFWVWNPGPQVHSKHTPSKCC